MNPRTLTRIGFLGYFLFTVWELWRFYQWALGLGPHASRPEATSGLVPVGALMSLGAWIKTGQFDPIMPAAVVIILAALVLSVLFKRGFCGYICPVGTVTSAIGWLGRRWNRRGAHLIPIRVDRALRVPKYLLGVGLFGSLLMLPVQVALDFQALPYYATSDMKILYGLLHPAWGYWVLAGVVIAASLATGMNAWCRYLCPLGAVYGAASVASFGVVRRDAGSCIECKACDKACTARIEVSATTSAVRSPECDGCQECVRACPVPEALTPRLGGAAIPWGFWAVVLVVTWLLIWSLAFASGHWQQGLPDSVVAEYMRTMKLTHDF